ncbi:hypothetical protein KUTeg_008197 [Tegillarca granosa]|uniref:Uncharacterized protein n=1 Tax=Tegillarca granosa TaxID=220873 RepID=A0ABQ9FAL8_TEGGR|nr:hypothetical protein KUTeg_008197 [Tegillarca granosa]
MKKVPACLVEDFLTENIKIDGSGPDLVEDFLTENIKIDGSGPDVLQSQLYIACFWGIKEIVQQLLNRQVNPNCQNKGTLWTPLHAATFQEHGPVVMLLLENGAQPELPDSEGRTPKDFASASEKVWPHFAIIPGIVRTSKSELVSKGVIKKASYSRPESAYAYNSDPFIHAAVTGDVLADQDEVSQPTNQPQFTLWR